MSIMKLVPWVAAVLAGWLVWGSEPQRPSGPELAAEVSVRPTPGELSGSRGVRRRAPWAPAETPEELVLLLEPGSSRVARQKLAALVDARLASSPERSGYYALRVRVATVDARNVILEEVRRTGGVKLAVVDAALEP